MAWRTWPKRPKVEIQLPALQGHKFKVWDIGQQGAIRQQIRFFGLLFATIHIWSTFISPIPYPITFFNPSILPFLGKWWLQQETIFARAMAMAGMQAVRGVV
jgi:hypothetical protein